MFSCEYPPDSKAQPPVFFACLFNNTDPVKFHECSHIRLRRLSDVSWHLERYHTLQEVKLCTSHGAEAAIKNGKEKGTCTDPKDIKVYCTICRLIFRGPSAEAELQRHLAGNICQPKTIEETGRLLPKELERVLAERDSTGASPEAKYYAMWNVCIAPLATTRFRNVPASPYIQTIVAREAAETLIRQVLNNLPITLEHHRSAFDLIVNGLYPVKSGADAEVKKIVRDQQKRRTSMLEEAEFDEFCRSTLGSSEVTPPDLSSTTPVHLQIQQQTLEQVNNGMMGLPSLSPGERQRSYPTMSSHYPRPETQAPSQMSDSVYCQYMALDDYDPSNDYTGGFSDTY
ncbi:hypothetical protein FNAPI_5130 [Fusarium napiforme]|uniref:Uncharacterized protein n=1 Tax=Fusarium napiforme TaxID=42672 RepID=A0A8H5JN42_9HYPO|nr:hypothetical protein FNAPI_5130 [Fusarium napiforme]